MRSVSEAYENKKIKNGKFWNLNSIVYFSLKDINILLTQNHQLQISM